jgi:hypothetical protein
MTEQMPGELIYEYTIRGRRPQGEPKHGPARSPCDAGRASRSPPVDPSI